MLKWLVCIKFSRAIFAWKKVKSSIYVTLQKMIPKNPADAIIAVMGDGNQCELLTLVNSRRVSLKLGRAWDFGSSRCPITAFMAKSARIWRYHFLKCSIYVTFYFFSCKNGARKFYTKNSFQHYVNQTNFV